MINGERMPPEEREKVVFALRNMVRLPLPRDTSDLTPELAVKIINKYREALSLCVVLLEEDKTKH